MSRVSDAPFDIWLKKSLSAAFGATLDEPIPNELLIVVAVISADGK